MWCYLDILNDKNYFQYIFFQGHIILVYEWTLEFRAILLLANDALVPAHNWNSYFQMLIYILYVQNKYKCDTGKFQEKKKGVWFNL